MPCRKRQQAHRVNRFRRHAGSDRAAQRSLLCASLWPLPRFGASEPLAARLETVDLATTPRPVGRRWPSTSRITSDTAWMTESDEEDRVQQPSASTLSIAPRAETILRQYFRRELCFEGQETVEALKPASSTVAKCGADRRTDRTGTSRAEPRHRVQRCEFEETELPMLSIRRVPGLSVRRAETLRYRRQMFRTDI